MPHTCHYQKYARLAPLRVLTTFIVHTSIAWTCVLELIGLEILFFDRARNNLTIERFIERFIANNISINKRKFKICDYFISDCFISYFTIYTF